MQFDMLHVHWNKKTIKNMAPGHRVGQTIAKPFDKFDKTGS
jgi:hypothetical protein